MWNVEGNVKLVATLLIAVYKQIGLELTTNEVFIVRGALKMAELKKKKYNFFNFALKQQK